MHIKQTHLLCDPPIFPHFLIKHLALKVALVILEDIATEQMADTLTDMAEVDRIDMHREEVGTEVIVLPIPGAEVEAVVLEEVSCHQGEIESMIIAPAIMALTAVGHTKVIDRAGKGRLKEEGMVRILGQGTGTVVTLQWEEMITMVSMPCFFSSYLFPSSALCTYPYFPVCVVARLFVADGRVRSSQEEAEKSFRIL